VSPSIQAATSAGIGNHTGDTDGNGDGVKGGNLYKKIQA
jgi:hypothetical protein